MLILARLSWAFPDLRLAGLRCDEQFMAPLRRGQSHAAKPAFDAHAAIADDILADIPAMRRTAHLEHDQGAPYGVAQFHVSQRDDSVRDRGGMSVGEASGALALRIVWVSLPAIRLTLR